MPDYCIEFLDAGEGVITEATYSGKSSLIAALYQIIHDLQRYPDLKDTCGLNVREVDASD